MQKNRTSQLHSVWTNPVVVVLNDGFIADGKNCVVMNKYPSEE